MTLLGNHFVNTAQRYTNNTDYEIIKSHTAKKASQPDENNKQNACSKLSYGVSYFVSIKGNTSIMQVSFSNSYEFLLFNMHI